MLIGEVSRVATVVLGDDGPHFLDYVVGLLRSLDHIEADFADHVVLEVIEQVQRCFRVRFFGDFKVSSHDLLGLRMICRYVFFGTCVGRNKVAIISDDSWMFLAKHIRNHRLSPQINFDRLIVILLSESVSPSLDSQTCQKVIDVLFICLPSNLFHDLERSLGFLNRFFEGFQVSLGGLLEICLTFLLVDIGVDDGLICAKQLSISTLDKIIHLEGLLNF